MKSHAVFIVCDVDSSVMLNKVVRTSVTKSYGVQSTRPRIHVQRKSYLELKQERLEREQEDARLEAERQEDDAERLLKERDGCDSAQQDLATTEEHVSLEETPQGAEGSLSQEEMARLESELAFDNDSAWGVDVSKLSDDVYSTDQDAQSDDLYSSDEEGTEPPSSPVQSSPAKGTLFIEWTTNPDLLR